MPISCQQLSSPVGTLFICCDDQTLSTLCFAVNWDKVHPELGVIKNQDSEILCQTRRQLTEYFEGNRKSFSLPLSLSGTDFQRDAWQALLSIPYGETRSYSEQAQAVGRPKATRAVGHANAANPIPIIVPCHRVIAKSGKLAGFAGGGETKRFLLQLEGINLWP
jgi:methylated-DNA-[protein]-cysteine S-methyltransferase